MGKGRLAVVLDADAEARGSLRDALELGGFTVHEAATMRDAAKLLARARPGLVVADLCLPDADGPAVVRQIRAASDALLVVVSSHDSTGDAIEALDAGADDFMPRPFSVREVRSRVNALIRRARWDGAAVPGPGDVFESDGLRLNTASSTPRATASPCR
ncbi:response regulator transcription factor [Zafaria sp. J156]|uniref:response regulator transcription factor n=1 Tax=Zafaria sp. J156 TaxID=3116490 RepID=UPI002E75BA83|nr:response regulator transcription factor [Zafaria sp. J156]MEE1620500.1 response regulator transcription factor [Zafaria sp. J156]